MGSVINKALGGGASDVQAPDYGDIGQVKNSLYTQMNNANPAMQTPGQALFQAQSQEALNKTLQSQAAQRGVRPSQLASMGNNAMANQQAGIVGQSAVRDAMERQAAQAQLADILMKQHAQEIGISQGNQGIEQQNINSIYGLLGAGATAGGMAYGSKK